MNKENRIRLLAITMLAVLTTLCTQAQGLLRDNLDVEYGKSIHEGRFRVLKVTNHYHKTVEITLINEYTPDSVSGMPGRKTYTIKSKGTWKDDQTCNIFRARVSDAKDDSTDTDLRWIDFTTKEEKVKGWNRRLQLPDPPAPVNPPTPIKPPVADSLKNEDADAKKKEKPLPIDTLKARFSTYLDDSVAYLSLLAIHNDSDSIQRHINTLAAAYTDSKQYVRQENLGKYIERLNDSLRGYGDARLQAIVQRFLLRYDSAQVPQRALCADTLIGIASGRINVRADLVMRLEEKMPKEDSTLSAGWMVAMICGVILIIFAAFPLLRTRTRKRAAKNVGSTNGEAEELITPPEPLKPALEEKTAPLALPESAAPASKGGTGIRLVEGVKQMQLKRQDISDVINDAAYMKIDSRDFCPDSTVGTIYVKNTCLKSIYNMYADDLRDPAKMNEDGCMVIGRWVRHEDTGLYDVTLEEIVLPGDDAVFSEYELNFGGKIKLKVGDRLRRLRQATGLQYDLTCWVHSHPGLGVFFSSEDNIVHNQLDVQTHPYSLTAMVIDILTEKQDLGIFTFKTDGTVNSKADLTRLYSLEDMFRWAVDSDRRSIKANDYFNTLGEASQRQDGCHGVHLSNGAAIDIALLAVEQKAGYVATASGFVLENGTHAECIVNKVAGQGGNIAGDEPLGCFLMITHLSLPTVKKMMGARLESVRFVMVYSTAEDTLTTIPVNEGKLSEEEKYCGEYKLEDIKTWTKRKR